MKNIVGYNRETMGEAGYTHKKRVDARTVFLWNAETGTTELWTKSPHFAGFAIVIGKTTYEFVGSVPDVRYCDECQAWESK